jgi:hypothetical protein
MSMEFTRSTRRLSEIIPDVLSQGRALLRKESQLSKAEVSEAARRFGIGAALLLAGVILLIPAFFILLLAGVAALAAFGFATYWAALIVAAGIFLVSAALLMAGLSRFKTKEKMLHKTAGQLRAEAGLIKRQFRSSDAFDTRA